MKHLIVFTLTSFLFLFSCEKSEITRIEDLRSQATVWKLESFTGSNGGGFYTNQIDSERTLQFWNGRVRTNGSFCAFTDPVGPEEEIDYDAEAMEFTVDGCLTASGAVVSETWPYRVNLEAGTLTISNPACVEGCWWTYRGDVD